MPWVTEHLTTAQLADLPKQIATSMRVAIEEEREACANVAENGRFLHDDSPEFRFGKECARAIRRRGD